MVWGCQCGRLTPTCVIKSPRTAAISPMLTLPKQSIAKLSKGNTNAKEEPNLEEESLKAVQPRAPSATSPSPIPHIGAAALAQGEGPQPTGNDQTKIVHYSDSLLLMSGPPPSTPEPKQAFLDADPSFTPSHLRRLNSPTFSLEGELALVADCYSISSWDTGAPSPLLLEVPSENAMQFDEELPQAIHNGEHAAALEIFSFFLSSRESQIDSTEAALLRRNCTRLYILLDIPEAALDVSQQDWDRDPEDTRNERLRDAATAMIAKS